MENLVIGRWYWLAGEGPMQYHGTWSDKPDSNLRFDNYSAGIEQVCAEVTQEWVDRWMLYRDEMLTLGHEDPAIVKAWFDWSESVEGKAAWMPLTKK